MKHVGERFLGEPTRFGEVALRTGRMTIDIDVTGPFPMARAAVAHMLAAGPGQIVNLSTNRETMRMAGFSPYAPSKWRRRPKRRFGPRMRRAAASP